MILDKKLSEAKKQELHGRILKSYKVAKRTPFNGIYNKQLDKQFDKLFNVVEYFKNLRM